MNKILVGLCIILLCSTQVQAGYWFQFSESGCANTCSGTYGYNFMDGAGTTITTYYMVVTDVVLTSCSGENPTIHAILNDTNASGFKFIIYDNDSGEPGNLVYVSASETTVGGETQTDHEELTIGTGCLTGTYWVGILSSSFIDTEYKSEGNIGARILSNGSYTPMAVWDTASDSESVNARPFSLEF